MNDMVAKNRRVLLVGPALPLSFWSFSETTRLLGMKTLLPPLGLITVAALLPQEWDLRLVDLNVRPLTEADWDWAEMVMVSAMLCQKGGMLALIKEAKERGKPVVVGGPYPTSVPDDALTAGCDFLIKGEGENAIPLFLKALAGGQTTGVFESTEKPDMSDSPVPRFDLLDPAAYTSMSVQTSRGCPFECEFCDVIALYGRKPRYKRPRQVIAELESIYKLGWRGEMFVADDNFIGNKEHARAILNELIPWSMDRRQPYSFITQTSVNLGQDKSMIDLMTEANFSHVFVGVESPDEDVLAMTHKRVNIVNPLVESLSNINRNGLTVIASFIIGFDGEKKGVGNRIKALVEAASIPVVMVNLLQAGPHTKLWDRLKKEGRLLHIPAGVSEDKINFIPTRPETEIMSEYCDLWDCLYDPVRFYERAHRSILEMRPTRWALGIKGRDSPVTEAPVQLVPDKFGRNTLAVLRRILWQRGVLAPYRRKFWKLVIDAYRRNPSRIRKFFILCATAENMFPLRKVIRQRIESNGCGNSRGMHS
ncbi:MAG: B12-binding domain-containing radical SAM protein [Verrucomicrobia bacterium]|nr:B12-binding domain-containing radical SAM protein [Verrucomicrobiota bacterium]